MSRRLAWARPTTDLRLFGGALGGRGSGKDALDLDRLDDLWLERLVARVTRSVDDLEDGGHPFHHLTEDAVAAVEVRLRGHRDEELAAVGVGPGICHGKPPRAIVAQGRAGLVRELVAGSTAAVAVGITAL